MKNICFLILLSTPLFAQKNLKLWYDKPATYFEETLVLGNGTQGATVFGGTKPNRFTSMTSRSGPANP